MTESVEVVWQGRCVECGSTTVFPQCGKPLRAQCAHCGDPILTAAVAMPTVAPVPAPVPARSPYQQGRDEERGSIVGWLRRVSAESGEGYDAELLDAARRIEAGEHLAAPESRDGGPG